MKRLLRGKQEEHRKGKRVGPRPKAVNLRHCCLGMEALELRYLLTVYTVNSLADNLDTGGLIVTLREAIEAASTNSPVGDAPAGSATQTDVINFAPSLNNKTIKLNRSAPFGSLKVNHVAAPSSNMDLIIDATSLSSLTISGNDPSAGPLGDGIRIFDINDPSAGAAPGLVSFKKVTLIESDVSGHGGAIYSEARLLIQDSLLRNNEASETGGAVHINVAVPSGVPPLREILRIENTIIEQNVAAEGAGISISAGSYSTASNDTITITGNTTITKNTAAAGNGGGISVDAFGASLTIDGNTNLTDNHSAVGGGGLHAHLDGGASITIKDSTFDYNTADNAGGGIQIGLGADISAIVDEVVRIENTLFDNNVAAAAGGVYINGVSQFPPSNDKIIFTRDTVFSHNLAAGGDGGGLSVRAYGGSVIIDSNSIFAHNDSVGNSGGLDAHLFQGASLTVADVVFEDNEVTQWGGGAFVGIKEYGTVTFDGATFHSNEAILGAGLYLHQEQPPGTSPISDTEIADSIFTNNIASGNGAGIHSRLVKGTSLRVVGSSFEHNENNTPNPQNSGRGGAIYTNMSGGSFELFDSNVVDNRAIEGGGVYVEMPTNLIDDSPIFSMQRTQVMSNLATNRGGGVFMTIGDNCRATISDSTISGNDAGLELSQNYFTQPHSGGGVYAHLSSTDTGEPQAFLTVSGTTIYGNTAGRRGGGIHIFGARVSDSVPTDSSGSKFAMSNSTLSGNQAGHTEESNYLGRGGGLFVGVSGIGSEVEAVNVDIRNVTITKNIGDEGAGIYSFTSPNTSSRTNVKLKNSIVSGNVKHALNPSNFWGSINVAETQNNLISDDLNSNTTDNRFETYDGTPRVVVPFSGLPNTNNNDNGDNSPGLTPLGDYGGPTYTHELLSTSPAIGAGSDALAVIPFTSTPLAFDQRGLGSPRKNGVVDIGAIERETGAPRVQSITIGSGDGTIHPPRLVSAGANQLKTVPVGRPDRLIVQFSENVTAVQGDLLIEGLRRGNTVRYFSTGVSIVGNVVTWTFDAETTTIPPSPVDDISDQLVFTIQETVRDTIGNGLDGEWTSSQFIGDTSGSTAFPSGDGYKLGDFVFHVTIFPGDFTLDNMVDGSDFGRWNSNKFTCPSIAIERFEKGDGNASGCVDGSDFSLWNNDKFTSWTGLPSIESDSQDLDEQIDKLVESFGVLNRDGTVNPNASRLTWEAFAQAVEMVFADTGIAIDKNDGEGRDDPDEGAWSDKLWGLIVGF